MLLVLLLLLLCKLLFLLHDCLSQRFVAVKLHFFLISYSSALLLIFTLDGGVFKAINIHTTGSSATTRLNLLLTEKGEL